MMVVCPYCNTEMKSDTDLKKGQNVICPCCKLKFAYGEENDTNGFYEAKFWSFVGRWPWSLWHKRVNGLVAKVLPFVAAFIAVGACVAWLVVLGRQNAPISYVFRPWLVLLAMALSVHLSRRAMTLPGKLLAKCDRLIIRPQVAYALKVIVSVGLIVLAGKLIIGEATRDAIILGIALALVGVAWAICMECTSITRIRVGTPANGVEEFAALVLLPVRFIAAMLPVATALTLVGGSVYACTVFSDSGEMIALVLAGLVMLPLVASLVFYLYYVCTTLALDFLKAVAAIPGRLDGLNQTLVAHDENE